MKNDDGTKQKQNLPYGLASLVFKVYDSVDKTFPLVVCSSCLPVDDCENQVNDSKDTGVINVQYPDEHSAEPEVHEGVDKVDDVEHNAREVQFVSVWI